MKSIVLSPEELDPDNFFFQWPVSTKMKHIDNMISKFETYTDHKLNTLYLTEITIT